MYSFICLKIILFIGNKINDNVHLLWKVKCVQSLKREFLSSAPTVIITVFFRVNVSLLLYKLAP